MSRATVQECRASRAQHLPETTHETYYTAAHFVDHAMTTASVGPCTAHVRHHVNVRSPTAAETQAIAETIILHQHRTDCNTVSMDSEGALRSFAMNDFPSPVHTSLTTYMQAHPTYRFSSNGSHFTKAYRVINEIKLWPTTFMSRAAVSRGLRNTIQKRIEQCTTKAAANISATSGQQECYFPLHLH